MDSCAYVSLFFVVDNAISLLTAFIVVSVISEVSTWSVFFEFTA